MSSFPEELRYSKEHEWLKIEGNTAVVGVTNYAAEQLGDIVHADLPEIGSEFEKEDSVATLESVKSVSDVFMPVSGKVLEVNESLTQEPNAVNDDPFGDGWILKVELSTPGEVDALLSADAYKTFLDEEA